MRGCFTGLAAKTLVPVGSTLFFREMLPNHVILLLTLRGFTHVSLAFELLLSFILRKATSKVASKSTQKRLKSAIVKHPIIWFYPDHFPLHEIINTLLTGKEYINQIFNLKSRYSWLVGVKNIWMPTAEYSTKRYWSMADLRSTVLVL
ncbi:hypothetical protein B0H34DRAFT_733157 [Crassisporium funariophilum]|nr:hypothetical protein B0H34DRAFT_733157 [Crassisporium funariophilum]